jgi:hypothetical protein
MYLIEFLDGFRTNTVFQQQDRDKLINLASSLSSFFDYTGITTLAQTRIASKKFVRSTEGDKRPKHKYPSFLLPSGLSQ